LPATRVENCGFEGKTEREKVKVKVYRTRAPSVVNVEEIYSAGGEDDVGDASKGGLGGLCSIPLS
jgi:hypothetical protein